MLYMLPAELLLLIASYLDSHTDTLRLATSCRSFYPLLLPKVFVSLNLKEHQNGHLSHLVHTLISKPALAQEVRTLHIYNGWRMTSGVRYEPEVILPLLESALGPGDNLSTSDWDRELRNQENNDAWTLLLLVILPNLEDLVLHVHEFSNYTLEWMARVAQNERPFLSRLKNLTVACDDVDGGLSSSHFLPILRLPSLRSFCGVMICDGGSSDEEYAEDQAFDAASYVPDNFGYSNVTHIHLKSSCSRRGFADLIAAPKNLESFILEYADNPNYADAEMMYASRFYPPLHRHRKTLLALTLGSEYTDEYTVYQSHDYDYVGSLAEFTALRELQLQISHILNWNEDWSDIGKTSRNGLSHVLPRSLESLILDGLEEEHITQLVKSFKDLLSPEEPRCPNLNYLEIKGNWMHVQQSTEESNLKPRPIPAMLEPFADFKMEIEVLCIPVRVQWHMRDLHVEHIIKENRRAGFWGDCQRVGSYLWRRKKTTENVIYSN